MKKLIPLPLLLLLTVWLPAQEVISVAGETQNISGYEISWTLGEPVIETVSTETTVLTQGFHQSKLTVTAIDELLVSDLELKVYPNPTTDFVIVHMGSTAINAGLSLFDFSGKLLQQYLLTEPDARLNLTAYASGTYILKIYQEDKTPVQSFKIIKR